MVFFGQRLLPSSPDISFPPALPSGAATEALLPAGHGHGRAGESPPSFFLSPLVVCLHVFSAVKPCCITLSSKVTIRHYKGRPP